MKYIVVGGGHIATGPFDTREEAESFARAFYPKAKIIESKSK